MGRGRGHEARVILEGIVTTRDVQGQPHLAPMGPRVTIENNDLRTLLLRPFPTSQTFHNLQRRGQGVFHLTDDVHLLARAAVGRVATLPPLREATVVHGDLLADACAAFEFQVDSIDTRRERMEVVGYVVVRHQLRPFWGFNRARNAVVEAAILATRLHLLPRAEVEAEFKRLRGIVDKTAGPAEDEAMRFLESYLAEASRC